MSDLDMEERSEQPTARRREEAAELGLGRRSRDLVVAFSLVGGFLAAAGLGPWLGARTLGMTRDLLREAAAGSTLTAERLAPIATAGAVFFFSLLLPVLAAAGGGAVAASTLQTGPRFQLRLLAPDPSRLHPIRGLGRLFSLEGAARGVFAVLKVAAAGWLLLRAIRSLVPGLHFPGGGTTSDTGLLAAACWSEAAGFGLRLGLAFLALALIDLAFQRWLHERGLRMTPAEVREEFHRLEGDPGVKERRRRAWRRLAESRQPRERQARRPDGAGDGRKPWRP